MTLTKEEQKIVDDFHRLYYDKKRLFQHLHFMGTYTVKYPTDLLVYAEILWECKPDIIIECGTHAGGSALFLATMLDAIARKNRHEGHIITIDAYDLNPPKHPRVEHLIGNSAGFDILSELNSRITATEKVMVILDSDHSEHHVARELELYSAFVTPGQYLIVEDTNLNGFPVCQEHGPGPMEAVKGFLARDNGFVIDHAREKFMLTANPNGFLKCIQ